MSPVARFQFIKIQQSQLTGRLHFDNLKYYTIYKAERGSESDLILNTFKLYLRQVDALFYIIITIVTASPFIPIPLKNPSLNTRIQGFYIQSRKKRELSSTSNTNVQFFKKFRKSLYLRYGESTPEQNFGEALQSLSF